LPPDPALKSRRFSVQEYRQWTDYVSIVNTLLAQGAMVRRTAVLHPIVSLWANFTPSTRSMYELHPNDRVRLIDESFSNLCRELIQHQIQYDIIDEKNLAAAKLVGNAIVIGQNSYDVIILPPMDTIRTGSLEVLYRFAEVGGTVLVHSLFPEHAAEGIERDPEVRKMMGAITSRETTGGIKPETTPIHYLIRSRIPPMCHLTPSSKDVLCTAVTIEGKSVFFLINASGSEYEGTFVFRAIGKPKIMDPANGNVADIESIALGETGTRVETRLAPYASAFVMFS